MKEDDIFWSNGRVHIKEINHWEPWFLIEWSCTKERFHKRGPYILVEWSCANKRNKSVETLNSSRMVVHIASAKITEHKGSISPYSFYGQILDCSVCNFQSMNSSMKLNSLFSKLLLYHQVCYMTWLDARMYDLQRRPLCFSERTSYGLKITNY